jgi:microcin C transport system permease protein
MIETWYFSDWKIKKINEEKNTITLTKKKFNGILHGFLGYSDKKGKNVSTLIAERLHISAFFGLTSLIIAYMVCIPLGIMKALKHGQKFDVLSSIIVFVGYSIPGYALGVLLLSYLGGDVFPLHGWRSPNFDELSVIGKIKDQLHHAFLPILCYMVGSFATMTVLMKNSLMENLSQDYVRTAFAKGLSEKRVIFFHAVRNSLIPLATGIGGLIGVLLAGNYLIEKTFDIDGIGLLGLNALLDKDYNIIMGFLVIGVMIRLLGNLISDLTYALIDPRIRFK